ncbi:MAG: hypothetical protein Q9220_000769 [cf. Caloplaca sp. 1 TL-2023]
MDSKVMEQTPPSQHRKRPFQILYFLETLYLFTLSDIKTFVIPETAFGLFGALSGPAMTTSQTVSLVNVVSRAPRVLLWTWLNTLMFTFSNQRLPDAVKEDKINKPRRPLAAGRIDCIQTRQLLLTTIPIVYCACHFIGAPEETLILTVLNWMYNELGASDENWLVRNLVLAATYAGYCIGAVKVASGNDVDLTLAAYQWVAIIAGVIFTTMHVQDLKDQEGDNARGRRTAPLVLGDSLARWTIAIPVLIWSFAGPLFWSLQSTIALVPICIGMLVIYRMMVLRGVSADRMTWKVWSLWLTVLYFLPVLANVDLLAVSEVVKPMFVVKV